MLSWNIGNRIIKNQVIFKVFYDFLKMAGNINYPLFFASIVRIRSKMACTAEFEELLHLGQVFSGKSVPENSTISSPFQS